MLRSKLTALLDEDLVTTGVLCVSSKLVWTHANAARKQ
jgi:hypothetical protein